MFDNVCKFLAESFSDDFATWLLGEPIQFTQLSPSELSLEPIRADALILLDSDDLILHLEFQTQPIDTIPFRMLDYRVRGHRRSPHKEMRQIVIYLKPSTSALVYETTFNLSSTRHEFEVIRLWEQPTEVFLQSPGLLPFAVLSQSVDKAAVLRAVADRIDQIDALRVQKNVAASTAILAGLVLEQETIQQILRSEIMRESVIYQDILAEGRAEGRTEGRVAEGRALILRQLNRRVGALPMDLQVRLEGLSLEQLENLGEALLDFAALADLQQWLNLNGVSFGE
ncbi:MAG: Rpn family recombination-promoting nuclease/putative transposase [Acaryochloridaceae cyanobacterium RU_4_10]|nr:Rpn family recombination-promoting nuclease/putative transposase [Acaryochloridaceae cyanobacterium RU_4_10]